MEIERKYLVKELPDKLDSYESRDLVQGYLSTNPVVRVRRESDQFYLTYKGKGLLAREEANLPLTKDSFEHLLEKADGIIIEKTRYLIPLNGTSLQRDPDGHLIHGGNLAELDIFHGKYQGLQLVEVEFDSLDQANAFTPPAWFGRDVTESGEYQNSRLSLGTSLSSQGLSHRPNSTSD